MLEVNLRTIIVLFVCSPTFALALEKGPDLRLQLDYKKASCIMNKLLTIITLLCFSIAVTSS